MPEWQRPAQRVGDEENVVTTKTAQPQIENAAKEGKKKRNGAGQGVTPA